MKTTIKTILFSTLLTLSTYAKAQLNAPAENTQTPVGFKADIEMNFIGEGDISDYTTKYDNLVSAEVFFNSLSVKLVVHKKQPQCLSQICNAIFIKPTVTELDVKFVERVGCYDSYHARSRDVLNDQIIEKVIIHRYSQARCPNATEIPKATLYYQVSGISAKNGELGSAWAMAKLLNLIVVKF